MDTVKESSNMLVNEIDLSEEVLQSLLEKYPDLLSIGRKEGFLPNSWLLVAREVGVPTDESDTERWFLDHLFLDVDAIPTLVEVKCTKKTPIRREVIGQMLDYAANAIEYWPIETIRTKFEATCTAKGISPTQSVTSLLNEKSESQALYERFWNHVNENLQGGRLRLIFLADKIPPDLRLVVKFLDEQMNPAEVWAIEIQQSILERSYMLESLSLSKKVRKSSKPNFDHLYSIAEDQAGYFTARQAREAGYSWERLAYYKEKGQFKRIAHGIYRLVHFPSSPFEDLFIAWLRTGPDSVISHESALSLYDLSDVLPDIIHVIVPRTASRRRKGLKQHTNRLSPDEITQREGLPITTVERTIADVSDYGIAEEFVNQAIREALQRGMTNRLRLLSHAQRRRGRAKKLIFKALE